MSLQKLKTELEELVFILWNSERNSYQTEDLNDNYSEGFITGSYEAGDQLNEIIKKYKQTLELGPVSAS